MDALIEDFTYPQVLLLSLFSYALGSIPVGLLLSRWLKGVDVRRSGSGNIGATNVARVSGIDVGVVTLLLDVAKGALPVGIASSLEFSFETQAAIGLLAFFGHCFPIWLSFKGGKGVATGLGVFLALSPWLAFGGLCAFVIGFLITKQVGIGSVVASIFTLGMSFFVISSGIVQFILAIMVFVIILRHQDNIRRAFSNREA